VWVLEESVVRLATQRLLPKVVQEGSGLAAACHQPDSDPFLDIAQIEIPDPWHRYNQVLIHQD
jgi:hypothetical protein